MEPLCWVDICFLLSLPSSSPVTIQIFVILSSFWIKQKGEQTSNLVNIEFKEGSLEGAVSRMDETKKDDSNNG